ncbi:hypothetical protein E2C01_091487 [Portunus trituberculatus]|uniref:Uncharacterized protein n=1 Tax=Portunus trituberculatus TaxID=210409 RepID=A0A5B7JHM9_PORTR|nr:hypothetical protein [Portunus trituberculatus]
MIPATLNRTRTRTRNRTRIWPAAQWKAPLIRIPIIRSDPLSGLNRLPPTVYGAVETTLAAICLVGTGQDRGGRGGGAVIRP